MYNGKKEVRGKFKLQNINNCKSAVVNEIMRTKDINLQINNIIRKDIIASAESRNFREDPVIREQFLKLFENLQGVPKYKQNYNSYAIKPLREQIDGISEAYIQKYCKEEYKKFTEILQRQSKLYAEGIGRILNRRKKKIYIGAWEISCCVKLGHMRLAFQKKKLHLNLKKHIWVADTEKKK